MPERLTDPSPEPTTFDQVGFVLDRFWLNGQQIDVKHVTTAEVEAWAGAVAAGKGRRGYPMPVVAVHGLVEGIVLSDRQDLAAELRGRLRDVPPVFRTGRPALLPRPESHIPTSWPPPLGRGDGLLFHSLAADYLRTPFIAWFAANDASGP